jgi:hypothetical protein
VAEFTHSEMQRWREQARNGNVLAESPRHWLLSPCEGRPD